MNETEGGVCAKPLCENIAIEAKTTAGRVNDLSDAMTRAEHYSCPAVNRSAIKLTVQCEAGAADVAGGVAVGVAWVVAAGGAPMSVIRNSTRRFCARARAVVP